MASVSEQLLENFSWRAWSQASDLHKRIWFTLAVFIVYRLGTYIPLPGINALEMKVLASQYARGFLGVFNMVSGGALERMSIFALNLVPYISASIIVQLMTAIFPYFEALKKQGEVGKRKLTQYTRYGTVLLASFQSLGVASLLMSQPGLVLEPGLFFYFMTMVTIVGSTLFLMWLGEQITSRGIGNGSSMIIFAGIIANLPRSIFQTLELSRTGGISHFEVAVTLLGTIFVIGFVIFMERAYRKVVVQYPKRQVGKTIYNSDQTYMPIKLNSTGVLAAIFAFALLGFFRFFAYSPFIQNTPVLGSVFRFCFSDGSFVFVLIQILLIIFFSFFYTSIVFNADETAETLRKNGAFIPGYRPGTMTADYIKYLLNRLTMVGSLYIAVVVVLPYLLNALFSLDFPFQGTSFLITVGVGLEIISQVHSYLISHQYAALLKKNKGGNAAKK